MPKLIYKKQIYNGNISFEQVVAPIGSIQASSVDLSNDGYILCDGRAVSRTDYAELFAKYNTMTPPLPFGSGDGSTTFNVPNIEGRVIEGASSSIGETGGEATHKLTVDEMPTHNHDRIVYYGNSGWTVGDSSGLGGRQTDPYTAVVQTTQATSQSLSHWDTNSTGGGQPHNNKQPFIKLYYFVKARNISQQEVQEAIDDTKTTASNVWSAEKVDEKFNDVSNELSTRMKKIVLTPRNIDFNSYTNEGIYSPYGDMNAGDWVGTSWTNAPVSKPQGGFSLTVIREGNYTRQIVFVYYDNHMYTRCQYYSSGVAWSAWRTI